VTARGNGGRIVGVFDASTLHQGVTSAAVPCAGGSGTTSISPWELTPNLAAIGSCSGMDSIDGGSDQPFGGCLPLMSESDSKPPRGGLVPASRREDSRRFDNDFRDNLAPRAQTSVSRSRGAEIRIRESPSSNREALGRVASCSEVSIADGLERGFAVLRAPSSATHVIVVPTTPISGIESGARRVTKGAPLA
jgi:CDP-diacylglycerol pyrophosphatase